MSGKKSVKPGTWTTPSGEVISEADAARLAEEFESDDASSGRCRDHVPAEGRTTVADGGQGCVAAGDVPLVPIGARAGGATRH